MAKKNKELVVNAESKFDGRLLTLWGKCLLQVLVLAIMTVIGAVIACVNVVGNGTPWAEDLQNPVTILLVLVGGIVIALGFCWACIIGIKWEAKHTVISGQRLKFNAGSLNLFFNCIKWTLLTIITLGIYALWMPIKVRKWQVKHTVSYAEEDEYGYSAPQITYYEYED